MTLHFYRNILKWVTYLKDRFKLTLNTYESILQGCWALGQAYKEDVLGSVSLACILHHFPCKKSSTGPMGLACPALLTQNTDAKTHTVAQRVQVHTVNVA